MNPLPDPEEVGFAQWLGALAQAAPIPVRFIGAVPQFPDYHPPRNEGPVPDIRNMPESVSELIEGGIAQEHGWHDPMLRFREREAGLRDLGWSLWPHGPRNLGSGAYGSVQLIFKTEDMNLSFSKRRMAAFKIQALEDENVDRLWTELSVMRSVRHRNIVDYYGAFVVTPRSGQTYLDEKRHGLHSKSPKKMGHPKQKALGPLIRPGNLVLHPNDAVYVDRWKTKSKARPATPEPETKAEAESRGFVADFEDPEREMQHKDMPVDTFCLLMEYANAGDLRTEIMRYPNFHLTESGARYYMREIIAGVSYLHGKGIIHDDLHPGNVVLKYNENGKTKRCLICDFGNCIIRDTTPGPPRPLPNFSCDIDSLKFYMNIMCRGLATGIPGVERPRIVPVLTTMAKDVINDKRARNCATLLAFPWFNQPAEAPVVRDRRLHHTIPVLLNPDENTMRARKEQSHVVQDPNVIRTYSLHPASVVEDPRRFKLLPTIGEDAEEEEAALNTSHSGSSSSSSNSKAKRFGFSPPPSPRAGKKKKKKGKKKSPSSSSSSNPDDDGAGALTFGLRRMRISGRLDGPPDVRITEAAPSSQARQPPGTPVLSHTQTRAKKIADKAASKPSGGKTAAKPSATGQKRKEPDSDNESFKFVYRSKKGPWSGQPGAPVAVADAQAAGSSGYRGSTPATSTLPTIQPQRAPTSPTSTSATAKGQKRKEPEPDDDSYEPSFGFTHKKTPAPQFVTPPLPSSVTTPVAGARRLLPLRLPQPETATRQTGRKSTAASRTSTGSSTAQQTVPLIPTSSRAKTGSATRQDAPTSVPASRGTPSQSAAAQSAGPSSRVKPRSRTTPAAATATAPPETPVRREGLRSGTRAAAAAAAASPGTSQAAQAQEDSSSESSDSHTPSKSRGKRGKRGGRSGGRGRRKK